MGELMRICSDIVKVCRVSSSIDTADADYAVQRGMCDRPKLRSWHNGRAVLVEAAAHPMSIVCPFLTG